ncbi:MAG: hypothetical protein JRI73_06545 [Deltaproteobacteria bacterium]|nr:hypothetical protein [Deltaproteobacteria bacterium]
MINIILAKRLQQIISDRINKEYCSNPQDLLQIMSFFNEERPLYVLIVDSLIGIILGDVFGIAEKGRACRTLINNYKIENTLLYILNNDKLDEHQKDNICAWLRAFQKGKKKMPRLQTNGLRQMRLPLFPIPKYLYGLVNLSGVLRIITWMKL